MKYLKKSESYPEPRRAFHAELEGAKDVQQALFPAQNLAIPGLSVETFYQPAYCIGGDYYDLLLLPSGRWGIAMGDVSGKGIGAALLMASLQASLRAQAMHMHSELSTLIANVNQLILAASPEHLYASLFYAEYDSTTRGLRYINVGHNLGPLPGRACCRQHLFYAYSSHFLAKIMAEDRVTIS